MTTSSKAGWRALGLTLAAGLALAACSSGGGGGGPAIGGGDVGIRLTEAALTRFDDCDAFETRVKAVAADQIGPYGLDGGSGLTSGAIAFEDVGQAVSGDAAAPDAPSSTIATRSSETAALPATGSGGDEWGGTNVQEEGVDEPDIVKVRGDLVVTLVDGTLRVVRIVDGQPQVQGELALESTDADRYYGGSTQLLADGASALLIDQTGWYEATTRSLDRAYSYDVAGTAIRKVDLSDPTNPTVVGTLELEGGLVDARLVDGVARVVTTSGAPDLPLVQPAGGGPRAEQAARELNEQAIAETEADDWLPRYRVLAAGVGETDAGPMVECAAVHTPSAPQGVGMLNVASFDLRSDALTPTDGVSILGAGHTVYASPEALYVATTNWNDTESPNESTDIHKFTSPERTSVVYRGSGRVDGHLLNQFSMSEHNGDLQVATTRRGFAGVPDIGRPLPAPVPLEEDSSSPATIVEEPSTSVTSSTTSTSVATTTTSASVATTTTSTTTTTTEPDPVPSTTVVDPPVAGASDSVVSVLRETDGALDIIGSVGGLGVGEEIQAVRFMGDIGYVVTFRQIDPLYTIDLRDPTAPRVAGELKVPGFSTYLHPIGDGRLLGVGQDATLEGRVTGMQLSLYDVSDPANPTELQKVSLPNASTEVEYDHHAFLWWDPTSMAMLPVQEFGGAGVFTGAVGYRVGADGIGELGRIVHPELPLGSIDAPCPPDASCVSEEVPLTFGGTPIRRSVVTEGMVVTVSSAGVMTSDLNTLGQVGWAAFG